MIIVDELKGKIDDFAGTDNPRHRCHRDNQSPRYCRAGLKVFFVIAFGALKRERESVAKRERESVALANQTKHWFMGNCEPLV